MANTYSFKKLIQLLSQNFDVKIIDYNEKKFKYVESVSENDLISVLTLFQSCFDD